MSQEVKDSGTSEEVFIDSSVSQSQFFKSKVHNIEKHTKKTCKPGKDVSTAKDGFLSENQTDEIAESAHLAQSTTRHHDTSDHFGQCSLALEKLKNEEQPTGLEQFLTTIDAENFCSCHGDTCSPVKKAADKSVLKVLQKKGEQSAEEGIKSDSSLIRAKIQSEAHIMSPPMNFSRLIDSEALGFSKNDSLWTAIPTHNKFEILENRIERVEEMELGTSTFEANCSSQESSFPYEGKLKRKAKPFQPKSGRSSRPKRAKIVYSCALCSFKSYGSKKHLKRHLMNHGENSTSMKETLGEPFIEPSASCASSSHSLPACGSKSSLKEEEKLILDSAGCSGNLDVNGQYKLPSSSSEKLSSSSSATKFPSSTSSYIEKLAPLPAFKQLLRCKYCYVKFEQYSDFKIHMKMHPSEGLLSCALCPYKSTYQNNIEEHVMSHHGCVNILLCM